MSEGKYMIYLTWPELNLDSQGEDRVIQLAKESGLGIRDGLYGLYVVAREEGIKATYNKVRDLMRSVGIEGKPRFNRGYGSVILETERGLVDPGYDLVMLADSAGLSGEESDLLFREFLEEGREL